MVFHCVPLFAQFVMEQGMEGHRWAELRQGLRFQAGAGGEVRVVDQRIWDGPQETKGL